MGSNSTDPSPGDGGRFRAFVMWYGRRGDAPARFAGRRSLHPRGARWVACSRANRGIAGKTTLLPWWGDLRVQQGQVGLLGQALKGSSGAAPAPCAPVSAYSSGHNLCRLSQREQNVADGFDIAGRGSELRAPGVIRRGRMAAAGWAGRSPGQGPPRPSPGGQKQRVAIARALAGPPGLLGCPMKPTPPLNAAVRDVGILLKGSWPAAKQACGTLLLVTRPAHSRCWLIRRCGK